MRGAIPPLPQCAFMAWCSVKAQGQFYQLYYTYFTSSLESKCYLSNLGSLHTPLKVLGPGLGKCSKVLSIIKTIKHFLTKYEVPSYGIHLRGLNKS